MPCHNLTDAALAAGVVKAFSNVVLNIRAPIQVRCEAAWAKSNDAAGKDEHANILLACLVLGFPLLCRGAELAPRGVP